MVKAILKEEKYELTEENVEITLSRGKMVTVTGPKGTLKRSFANTPAQIVAEFNDDKKIKSLTVRVWFAKSKARSIITTIVSHIRNMVIGVTSGYHTVMKFGFNLTPMLPVAIDNGQTLQVTNYLGEKIIRKIRAGKGCRISSANGDAKKEIDVYGLDKEEVGQTCARIQQSCKPKNKDRRKFKDGIYAYLRKLEN